MVVCAAGVENHQEFADLAEKVFGFIKSNPKLEQRHKSKYFGGEVKELNDSSSVTIALAF